MQSGQLDQKNNNLIDIVGYTNYTQEEQERGVVADFVLVQGEDNANDDIFAKTVLGLIEICEKNNLKYVILGNGKKGADLKDFEKLPKTNNIAIFAHGDATKEGHVITLDKTYYTKDILNKLQGKTECRNFIVDSCFGGKVVSDLQNSKDQLKEGTILTSFSAPDEVSFNNDHISILKSYVYTIKPLTEINLLKFTSDILKNVSQTTVVAYQLKDELASVTLARGNRHIVEDIEKFYEYQISILNKFINELLLKNDVNFNKHISQLFPDVDLKSYIEDLKNGKVVGLLDSSITKDQIETLGKRANRLHLLHSDIKVLDLVYSKIQIDPLDLFLAIHHNLKDSAEVVRLILKYQDRVTHGQNTNAFVLNPNAQVLCDDKPITDYTPLTHALNRDATEIIQVLMELGADIFLPDKIGRIPIEMMKKNKDTDKFFKVPLKKASRNHKFLETIEKNSRDIFTDISNENNILQGINAKRNFKAICEEENDGIFYIGYSDFPKNKRVYEAFQAYILAINKIDPDAILETARIKGLNKPVKVLLYPADKLYDSLSLAAEHGNLNLVKSHLFTGENTEPYYGETPLALAVKNGHLEIVEELLKYGAKEDPLYLAISSRHLNFFNLLIENGLQIKDDEHLQKLFFKAIESSRFDIVKKLTEEMGANINKPNRNGVTPLQISMKTSNDEMMQYLIGHGADVSQLDKEGNTLLHLAIKNNSEKLIKTLLRSYPGMLNSPNKNGEYPLTLAAQLYKDYPSSTALTLLFNDNVDYKSNNPLANKSIVKMKLENIEAPGIILKNSDLAWGNFKNCKLSGGSLFGADLHKVDFTGADLTHVDLRNVRNLDLTQLSSAQSIRNVKLDSGFLNKISKDKWEGQDHLTLLKKHMVNQYEEYIKSININDRNIITDFIVEIENLIKDKENPLRYRQNQFFIFTYANTKSLSNVVDMGCGKINEFLKANPYDTLPPQLKDIIEFIAKSDTTSLESDTRKLFWSSDKKSPKDELLNILEVSRNVSFKSGQ